MVALVFSIVLLIVLVFCFMNEQKTNNSGYSIGSSKGGLNNPGNLVSSSAGWLGAQKPNTGLKFENFDTLENGIRAWYINLYGKINKGIIKDTNDMIDILTPAGKENPENARNNYKNSVAQATSWLELGRRVFDFEANPDWVNCTNKTSVLNGGLSKAYDYLKQKYHLIGIPQYTLKP